MNKTMNNNFDILKTEATNSIDKQIRSNYKEVEKFINNFLLKFNSNLKVLNNFSIASFKALLINSSTPGDLINNLSKLDITETYEIYDYKTLKDDIEFNEEFKSDDIEEYEVYKSFLNSAIKLNDNLYMIKYI